MKVLFLNPIGELGGAERSLLDLIRSLRESAESVEVAVAAFAPGPFLEAARALGCEVVLIPLPSAVAGLGDSAVGESERGHVFLKKLFAALARSPAFTLRLRREIASAAPDILHTNGFKAHLFGAIARPAGVRLVWHLRDFLGSRPFVRRCLPLLAGRADLAIAISKVVAADARALLSVPVVTVLNGIDTRHFAPGIVKPLDLDEAAGMAPAEGPTTRVGLVATYAWWKGHEVFLQAAARLKDLPLRFYIVGGRLYETASVQRTSAELGKLISDLDLGGSVGLVPFQSDPRPAYLALDVVVHASTAPEPFGRTIAEAMSSGRAVIASAAGATTEQIEDGRTGFLFPSNDPETLARRIAFLYESPTIRAALGVAARTAAVASLDYKRLGPAILAHYQQISQLYRIGSRDTGDAH